ncbi:hypothetical protein OAL24_01675 [Oenococcus sicerae]|nr:hypothetical protein OAL24_01675 [Oenococcus sicerae]
MFAIIIGFTIGVGLPLQTAVNSRLRKAFSSPLLSSMTSFTIGTIFLAIATLLTKSSLGVSGALMTSQPWWIWIGGLFGVIFLTGNIIIFPYLGGVQTVIMPIVGQIIMSMLIDNFGWFDSPTHSLGLVRIIGAVLVLIGVFLSISGARILALRHDKMGNDVRFDQPHIPFLWLWRTVGILTGMLSASQTAINGHLGIVLHSAVKASFISFLVGAAALWVIVLLVEHGYHFAPVLHRKSPLWMWIGGLIGAVFVLGNAYLVPLIGTGLTVVIVLLGQIVGSMLVDQFGWFGAQRNPIVLIKLLGILVMLFGVVLIKLF